MWRKRFVTGNFGYALQGIVLLTALGTAAEFGYVRSAWAQEVEDTKQVFNALLALEVASTQSDIGQDKCEETERRLKMEQQPSDNGIINRPSKYSVKETLDRLEALLKSKDITIFARIDQKAAAEKVGLSMQPTELLLFGDPRAGTPLMNSYPSLAIDLPLKAVAWESKDGRVILSYNSPEYLKQRHGLAEAPFRAVEALIEKALE
ncbi:MAG: DUF302 domain-containing protein [Thermodesulfovibrionales bacterium]|jgi:uncharacterized protein (DUF302 family)